MDELKLECGGCGAKFGLCCPVCGEEITRTPALTAEQVEAVEISILSADDKAGTRWSNQTLSTMWGRHAAALRTLLPAAKEGM